MSEKTGEEMLKQMMELEPSKLDENTQKLFYKIMEIIDERDKLKLKQKKIIFYLDSLISNELDLTRVHKHYSYLHEYQEILSNCLKIIADDETEE